MSSSIQQVLQQVRHTGRRQREAADREAGKEATKKAETTDPKRPGLGKVPGSQPSPITLHVLLQRGTRSPKRTGLTHSGTQFPAGTGCAEGRLPRSFPLPLGHFPQLSLPPCLSPTPSFPWPSLPLWINNPSGPVLAGS